MTRKYILLLFIALFLYSCEKEQDPGDLDDIIYVRYKGADMPVYMHGNIRSGVILLVVHGGPGGNGLEYRSGLWTVDLEKNYAVAYWDQRGQGMAQGHYDKSAVTIAQMADDMDAVVKVLKTKYGEKVEIFALGHSWGGTLTSKYMITDDYQYHLQGWIEFDGAHDMPQNDIESVKMFIRVANEQIAAGNSVENWQDILDWAGEIDTNNISMEQSLEINKKGFEVEEWLKADGVIQKGESGGTVESDFCGQVNPVTSSITGLLTNITLNDENSKYSATDELYKVEIPSLFIWGKYDFVVPPTLGYDAFNRVSSTVKAFVLLEKSGHSGMDNEWEKTKDAIIMFIEDNR